MSPRSPEPNRAVGETGAPVPAERRLAGLPVLAGGEAGGVFPQRFRADALDGQRSAEKGERLRRPEKNHHRPGRFARTWLSEEDLMKKRTRRILILTLAAVFAVSLGALACQRMRYGKNDRAIDDARRLAGVPAEGKMAPQRPRSAPAEEEPPEEVPDPWADIDLDALREVNEDVVGWLAIPGTEVSYPLIRPQDNETYLSRSWDGTPTSAGAIFLDCRAAWEPRGFNTIIYGHNMRNRTMFGSLRDYRGDSYWQEHPEICLIDSGGVHYYDIFAAWEPRVTDPPFAPEITTEKGRRAFIDTALGRSVISTGVVPTVDSEILTLSTCTGVGYATRWVIQAALRTEK